MAFYFFDTSALVKYYVTEPGSTWVRRLIEAREPGLDQVLHVILVAEITRVEVAAGLAVIERVGRIHRSERDREYRRFMHQYISRYTVVPLLTEDVVIASDLTLRHPLKAYDAMQLAVALRYHRFLRPHQSSCLFVSGDNPLNHAAELESLSTDNPFEHLLPEDTAGQDS